MRMHQFKTSSEANQACFVPRSLVILSIKPVEVSESSLGYPARNGEQWQGSSASHNQVFPLRGEAGSDCVSCLCQWLPRLLRWGHTFLSYFKASVRGSYHSIQFSSFEEILTQRCLDLPGHLHYPVVLVTLPHDLSCIQALLLTGHRSLCQPRTARQKLIYCIPPFLATQWATNCSRWHRKSGYYLCPLSLHNLGSRRLFPDWKSG